MANIIIAKIGIVNMRFHGIVNEDIVANRGIAFVLKGVLPVMDLLESREFIRAKKKDIISIQTVIFVSFAVMVKKGTSGG